MGTAGISFTGRLLASLRRRDLHRPVDWCLGETAVSTADGTVARSPSLPNVMCTFSLDRRVECGSTGN